MRAWVLLFVVGCRYEPKVAPTDGALDSEVDAPTSCTPGTPICVGRTLGTCNADGDGIEPSTTTDCLISCVPDPEPHCAAASNLAEADQLACLDSAIDLTPATGTVSISGTGAITCAPGCGNIPRAGTLTQNAGPNVHYVCLGTVTIPAAVTFVAAPTLTEGVLLFATGPVTIDGEIVFDGEAAKIAALGRGGPGATEGGGLTTDDGNGLPAPGTCGGLPGTAALALNSKDGSGGGGGGHGGAGGEGGDGLSDLGIVVDGAAVSASACGAATLSPLTGGAGGGGGGDGECGGTSRCGFPGGGGGGALQISSRGPIVINGAIRVRGGVGFGNGTSTTLLHGGAGGGGAGGGILLESTSVTFGLAGVLDATGGAGGSSGAGAGGPGANASPAGSPGASAAANDLGGAGGGGGGGVIRVNAPGDPCARALPLGSCTTGVPPRQTP